MTGQGRQMPLSHGERDQLSYEPAAVGRALAARRISEGLSAVALARLVRVDAVTVRNWERGGMSLSSARLLSYTFSEGPAAELWHVRALLAEAALRRMTETLGIYRGEVRAELAERRNGAHP